MFALYHQRQFPRKMLLLRKGVQRMESFIVTEKIGVLHPAKLATALEGKSSVLLMKTAQEVTIKSSYCFK